MRNKIIKTVETLGLIACILQIGLYVLSQKILLNSSNFSLVAIIILELCFFLVFVPLTMYLYKVLLLKNKSLFSFDEYDDIREWVCTVIAGASSITLIFTLGVIYSLYLNY